MEFENELAILLEFPELRCIDDLFEVRGNITRHLPTYLSHSPRLLLVSLSAYQCLYLRMGIRRMTLHQSIPGIMKGNSGSLVVSVSLFGEWNALWI
jgi:hypothetical protein